MQNNRREIHPPQEKEDEDTSNKEDESGETEKDKLTIDCDRSLAEDEIKDEMANEEGKEEMVVGDDGNWKRAKKREDEDEDGKKGFLCVCVWGVWGRKPYFPIRKLK